MFCITVDAEGRRRIMPHYIILHRERRCAPFVWIQAFFPQLWLAHLPSHRPELTFAPHPDAEITPSAGRQAAGSHISPIFLHWGVAGQTRETAAKIWPAGGAQGCTSSENWVETLIISTTHHHFSLCLILSSHHRGSFSVFLFLPSSQFIIFFSPIPQHCPMHCILPPLLTFTGLSGALSALTADEVSQMKPYACTPDHSPQTMAKPDMISTTILPICRSRAKGL